MASGRLCRLNSLLTRLSGRTRLSCVQSKFYALFVIVGGHVSVREFTDLMVNSDGSGES